MLYGLYDESFLIDSSDLTIIVIFINVCDHKFFYKIVYTLVIFIWKFERFGIFQFVFTLRQTGSSYLLWVIVEIKYTLVYFNTDNSFKIQSLQKWKQ